MSAYYAGGGTDALKLKPESDGRDILVAIDRSLSSWNALKFCISNIAKSQDLITLLIVLDPRDLYKSDADADHYQAQVIMNFNN